MNRNIKKFFLIYLVIWLLLILFFWIFSIEDGFGYNLIAFYIVLPVITFTLSVFIGKEDNNFKYILPFVFGFMYMFAEYLTFSLANMISFSKVNIPEFSMIFIGTIISFIGIEASILIKHK